MIIPIMWVIIMRALSCKDLGAGDNFVAVGKTDKEVVDKMMMHAKHNHKDLFRGMTPKREKEMGDLMKNKIHKY